MRFRNSPCQNFGDRRNFGRGGGKIIYKRVPRARRRRARKELKTATKTITTF